MTHRVKETLGVDFEDFTEDIKKLVGVGQAVIKDPEKNTDEIGGVVTTILDGVADGTHTCEDAIAMFGEIFGSDEKE